MLINGLWILLDYPRRVPIDFIGVCYKVHILVIKFSKMNGWLIILPSNTLNGKVYAYGCMFVIPSRKNWSTDFDEV